MISYKAALLAWIFISFALMADRNSARGFSIAFIGSLMFMPAKYGIDLPGLPSLEKFHVACLGVLLGTIVFHPKVFDNLKFVFSDLLLIGGMQVMFASSIMNDQGNFAALSRSVQYGMEFALPIFLARLHIGTPRGIRTFLLTLVLGACIYMPLALWEFRMSPQLHTQLYGYFQHMFAQFKRGGFFRPVVFFAHALDLGRFFAFAAFLAMFPMRRDLTDIFGRYGKFLFVVPLFALLISMSWGPYMMFGLLCVGYFLVQRHSWAAYVLPALAFGWLMLLFAGFRPGFFLVQEIYDFNPARAQSLAYRLRVLEFYEPVVKEKPMLGYGGFGNGRIEGLATDSQALMNILQSGFFGASIYYAWWVAGMHYAFRVMHKVPGTILAKRAAAVGAMASLALSVNVIDQALNDYLLLLLGGFVGVHLWMNSNQTDGATEKAFGALLNRAHSNEEEDLDGPPHRAGQPG